MSDMRFGPIVAVKYDGGIVLASDTNVTYGKSIKFANVTHFAELTPTCVLAASGDVGDFQQLLDIVTSMVREEQCKSGSDTLAPSEIYTYVKRFLYQRRTNMKPLVLVAVVAGINRDGTSFLACADLYGTAWEDDVVCTSIAAHMKGLQLDRAVNRSRDEVVRAIGDVWRALKVRYVLSSGEVEILDVSRDGIQRLEKLTIPSGYQICEGTGDKSEIVLK